MCITRMKIRFFTTLADRVLMVSLVVLAAAMFFLVPRWVFSGGSEVEIRLRDKVIGRYSLDRETRVEAPGRLGTTVVRIRGGHARIESAPCPHKLCVRMGEVGREGGIIVCIPNEVVVRVGKGRLDGLDAVSR